MGSTRVSSRFILQELEFVYTFGGLPKGFPVNE